MKRRTFLLFSIFILITKGFANNKQHNEFNIIKDIFNHLFPNTKLYSGASVFGAFDFFVNISKHPSFDKDDLNFLMNGAKRLMEQKKDFLILSKIQKEQVLRDFEKTNFGQNWLSLVLYYGFEAMFSDPIYKGNKNMTGWKNINHTAPTPMAKYPFGKSYDTV